MTKNNKLPDYSTLRSHLENIPQTWVPALLVTVVERAVEADVFIPGGIERFVAKVVRRVETEKSDDQ